MEMREIIFCSINQKEKKMTQVVNESKSHCSFFTSALLVHRLQLMPIASDMR